MDDASVKVALRVRPLTSKEQMQNCTECIGYVPGVPQVVLGSARGYTYDHVFQPDSRQPDIYHQAVVPLIGKFFQGYNATVLAYGQVGLMDDRPPLSRSLPTNHLLPTTTHHPSPPSPPVDWLWKDFHHGYRTRHEPQRGRGATGYGCDETCCP